MLENNQHTCAVWNNIVWRQPTNTRAVWIYCWKTANLYKRCKNHYCVNTTNKHMCCMNRIWQTKTISVVRKQSKHTCIWYRAKTINVWKKKWIVIIGKSVINYVWFITVRINASNKCLCWMNLGKQLIKNGNQLKSINFQDLINLMKIKTTYPMW